jgi:RNA polymerase sigma-70 factor, ECF subfamily
LPSPASSLRIVPRPAPAETSASGIDLDALFREHAPMVASIGFRILGRSGDVEDLVQDVFMDAWRDRTKIHTPEAIKGWLAVCTMRRARRLLRQRRLRRLLGLDQPVDYEAVSDPSASPAQRALLARVYAVLDEMDVDLRLAWTLRHVEGFDLEAVARLCNCSLATVKRRISAAGRHIAKRLA